MLSLIALLACVSGTGEPVVFETDTFQYRMSEEAASIAFVDKTAGIRLLRFGQEDAVRDMD